MRRTIGLWVTLDCLVMDYQTIRLLDYYVNGIESGVWHSPR